jgi:hypothetical protein
MKLELSWESYPEGKLIPLSKLSRGVIQAVERYSARITAHNMYYYSRDYMKEAWCYTTGRKTTIYIFIGGRIMSYIKLSMTHA